MLITSKIFVVILYMMLVLLVRIFPFIGVINMCYGFADIAGDSLLKWTSEFRLHLFV